MDNGADFFLDVLTLCVYSQSAETKQLISRFIELYDRDAAANPGSVSNDQLSKLYLGIIRSVASGDLDMQNEGVVSAFGLKFAYNPLIEKDPDLLKQLKNIFLHRKEATHRQITHLQDILKKWIILTRTNEGIRKVFSTAQKITSTTDKMKHELLFSSLRDHTEALFKAQDDVTHSTTNMGFVDMNDKESIRRVIEQNNRKRKSGILRAGIKGINRMFGKDGGIVRGSMVGIGALSHHYKSGRLMDWLFWLTHFNKPVRETDRTPCLVFISLENELDENVMSWYRTMYVHVHGKEPVGLSDNEIVDFLAEFFSRNGWRVFIYRELSENFGYAEWVKIHHNLMENGFEIVASILDYIGIGVVKLDDNSESNSADKLQIFCNRVANYGKHNNITIFAGMQLNSKANEIVAGGPVNIVKRFGPGHIAGSQGTYREYDIFIFQHIEKNALGQAYLTEYKHKHRYNGTTPEEDKYCAVKFTPLGIPHDLDSNEDLRVANIYADSPTGNVDLASAF